LAGRGIASRAQPEGADSVRNVPEEHDNSEGDGIGVIGEDERAHAGGPFLFHAAMTSINGAGDEQTRPCFLCCPCDHSFHAPTVPTPVNRGAPIDRCITLAHAARRRD
jgi:hypothetical protein